MRRASAQRIACGGVALMAACGCTDKGARLERAADLHLPEPRLAPRHFSAPVAPFNHFHATPRHDSHVSVQRRPLSGFSRLSLAACPLPFAGYPRGVPLAVVTSPNAEHVVVMRANTFDLLDANGGCQIGGRSNGNRSLYRREADLVDVLATEEELLVDGNAVTWRFERIDEVSTNGSAWSRDVVKYDYVAVYNRGPMYHPHGGAPLSPKSIGFDSSQRFARGERHWYGQIVEHHGLGVIAADWSIVLWTDDGNVLAYAPRANAKGEARLIGKRQVSRAVEHLSLVGEHIALLEPRAGGTRLTALTSAVRPAFTVDVPFAASQPAIWGRPGRIYLAGVGLAALDQGKLSWTLPYDAPIQATSFDDGSLVVASGSQLELIDPDGKLAQTLDLGEPLLTQPAIAADGSVYVASLETVFVVR